MKNTMWKRSADNRRGFIGGSDVRFVPCVDGSGLARTIFTLQLGSVRPCVRPLSAVHMTAGHNALRGSGPGQKDAFDRCAGTIGLS
jgi:hypothetical protein